MFSGWTSVACQYFFFFLLRLFFFFSRPGPSIIEWNQ